jgi:ABC-type lipoprotein export system ATPase subunit
MGATIQEVQVKMSSFHPLQADARDSLVTGIEGGCHPHIAGGRAVSFKISRGQSVAICGPSGSGKSTLLRVLCGFESLRTGSLLGVSACLDMHALGKRPWQWRRGTPIGYVPQDPVLLPFLAPRLQVDAARWLTQRPSLGRQARSEAVCRLGLNEVLQQHHCQRLSGGERARLALLQTLVTQPFLLLMDETLGRVEPELAARILRFLKDRVCTEGGGVLVVTHVREIAELCDDVVDLGHQHTFVKSILT